ncbi:hypothetical protein LJC68_00820 [Bacteroidales bacterium OttesenSCG-928-B11]|nr:hypothetical protein [Bacteroidales bacterium OttesenSCG-928-E04]MDL2308510.1 hypothetical protein [Bacteroidales bacterium OttesenSCG-928-C03]MDL2311406.1 hypothetical protein [Bacteroidales bacterium OttesenSCG-928-B11]MDL2325801.1 hypothetical protein [Bacteroidales bacterium OttesenSCG-928-A14]
MKKYILCCMMVFLTVSTLKGQTVHIYSAPYIGKIFDYYRTQDNFTYINRYFKKDKHNPIPYRKYILTTKADPDSELVKKLSEEVRYATKNSSFKLVETVQKEGSMVEVYEYTHTRENKPPNKLIFSIIINKEDRSKSEVSLILTTYYMSYK